MVIGNRNAFIFVAVNISFQNYLFEKPCKPFCFFFIIIRIWIKWIILYIYRIEDNDDLVHMLNGKFPHLLKRYGEFYISEIISNNHPDKNIIVAEVIF